MLRPIAADACIHRFAVTVVFFPDTFSAACPAFSNRVAKKQQIDVAFFSTDVNFIVLGSGAGVEYGSRRRILFGCRCGILGMQLCGCKKE